MKLVTIGDIVLSKIDQDTLPQLPDDKTTNMELSLASSKWNHAEEEWVVAMLSSFAVKNGAWCPVLWKDLVKMSKKENKHLLDHELMIAVTISNMVATGDLMIVHNIKDDLFYIVPLPSLGKTIASCGHEWRRK